MKICSFEGCGRKHDARGLCAAHRMQLSRGKTLTAIQEQGGWLRGKPKKSIVGYSPAHKRVYQMRGKASNYTCSHCHSLADEWALDHSAGTQYQERIAGVVKPYSLEVGDYMPLCRSCHRKYDSKEVQYA